MLKHLQKLDTKLHTFNVYLLGIIILAVPLYPKFPFLTVPGTFVSIRLEDFLIALLAVSWGMSTLPNIRLFVKDPINKAFILFLSAGLLSLLSALFVTKSVNPLIGALHWARRIEYFIPFFVARSVIKREPDRFHFYIKNLLIVVGISFLIGAGQKYLNWPIIITQNLEYSKGVVLRWISGSHINATFAGHYDLATFLVLFMPFAVASFALAPKKMKVVWGVIFLFGLWLIINAISRISIVSYLMGVTLSLVFIKKYKYIPFIVILSLALFSTDPGLQTRYGRIIEVLKERSEKIMQLPSVSVAHAQQLRQGEPPTPTPTPIPVVEDRSSSIRFQVEWPRAIRALQKNPVLGTGYSSITLATDNNYLRILGEIGLLGFFAFILIFVRILEKASGAFPLVSSFDGIKLAYVAGVSAAIPGIFLNAVFIDIFAASKFAILFWTMIGIYVGLLSNKVTVNNKKGKKK